MSAVKACEDGDGWLVRAVNLEGRPIQARLQLWRRTEHAEQANLMEQPQELLTLEDGKVLQLLVGAHKISTFRFQ
jgi:alpha-mannosidase